jgi:hypothetical protein
LGRYGDHVGAVGPHGTGGAVLQHHLATERRGQVAGTRVGRLRRCAEKRPRLVHVGEQNVRCARPLEKSGTADGA